VLKLADPIDADQQQWARAVIERQTQHLTRLVDDLLDVSRITQCKVTLQREPLELSTIISRAVEASRPLTAERRHDLRVTLPPEPIRVSGDLTRLVQVVGNLLNNAAKYSDEGSHIWLEAQQEGNEVVLRVRDEGIGLSDDLRPHIFDLFTQADRSLDRAQGGLGIGLTLVRNLVELHGGKVEAKSEGPSRGSEFIVRLPAHAPAPVPNAAQESCGEPLGNSSPALRVLVVEDNFDSAEMLALMLELNHHEVRVTHDGPSALAVMQEFQPQVVLCDIGLPGMNGYEVAQELRARSEFKKTRLIALSGYGRDEDRHRSRESGFDSHLMKPVEPDVLEALLSSVRAGFEG
jgi:CheY-like chemotaxis protein